MTVKTIHILDNSVMDQLGMQIPMEYGYDRLSDSYPPLHAIISELIEDGEIPRYRDVESEITVAKNITTITTVFATKSGAEKWADWVVDDGTALVSITVVED
jgi:hypothetical protein